MSRLRFALVGCALVLSPIAASSGAPGAELTFNLEVQHGRIRDGNRLIRVVRGDIVTLRWTTDEPIVLHLHGYDIETHVDPGAVAGFTFTAYATGRFPLNIHARAGTRVDVPLADVEVWPR